MRFLDSPRERAQGLVVALGLLLLVALVPFVTGLIGAVVLEVIFAPVQRRLRRRMPEGVAAGISTAAAAFLLLLPAMLLIVLAVGRAPQAIDQFRHSVLLERITALHVGPISIGAELQRASGALVSWISRRGLALFGSATDAALQLIIALFGTYYLLISGAESWRRVRDALPFSAASAELLRERLRSVTEAMLLGVALTAVMQGALVALGFVMVGFDDAPFWGVVTAAASIFPLFGAALVWGPGVVILLASGRYGAAIVLLVVGSVASTVDNLVRPFVYRRVSHIHPMTTIVGAFAGVAWLGLTGLLIGPLALSYFFELLRIYGLEYAEPTPAPILERPPAPHVQRA